MMTPTAISQIVEQVVRVVTMIALAVILLPYGLEYGAAGATLGAAPGHFWDSDTHSLLFYDKELAKRISRKPK